MADTTEVEKWTLLHGELVQEDDGPLVWSEDYDTLAVKLGEVEFNLDQYDHTFMNLRYDLSAEQARAEAAEARIGELEAKLAEVEEMKRLLAMDKINLRGELAGVQGKLAKADRLAEVLNDLLQDRGHCFIPNRIAGREDWDEDATEALKDFKGERG